MATLLASETRSLDRVVLTFDHDGSEKDVANNFTLHHSYKGQQVITVLPQLVYEVGFLPLTESPCVHFTDCLYILWLFFANRDHFLAPNGGGNMPAE